MGRLCIIFVVFVFFVFFVFFVVTPWLFPFVSIRVHSCPFVSIRGSYSPPLPSFFVYFVLFVV